MASRTKILIFGNSPVLPSGKAEPIRVLFEGLLSNYPEAYELHQIGLFHSRAVTRPRWPVVATKASKLTDGSVQLSPDDLLGQKTLPESLHALQPDILFIFATPTLLGELGKVVMEAACKLVIYLKIDDYPVPLSVGCLLDKAQHVITMSEESQKLLLSTFPSLPTFKVGFLYSPADTDRFGPLDDDSRRELRKTLLPQWMPETAFVLGWVGSSCWRKQTWLLYKLIHYLRSGKYLVCEACGLISTFDWDPSTQSHMNETGQTVESRPGYGYEVCAHCSSNHVQEAQPLDDAFLWLHMTEDNPGAAWPLSWLEKEYGLRRNRDIYYTEGYNAVAALPPEDMPALYQLWDVLIYLSGSEGFGLPAWEAMCSSLPVIYTNFSSHSEYLNRAASGLPIGGFLQPERKTGFWRMIADLPEAIRAVRRLYFDRELGKALGVKGRSFVKDFSVNIQVEKWHRIFQSLGFTKLI